MTYTDGTVFDGTWSYDKRTDGRQVWPDGRVYTGDWKDDQMSGNGRYTSSDGTVYQGEFIANDYRMSLHI